MALQSKEEAPRDWFVWKEIAGKDEKTVTVWAKKYAPRNVASAGKRPCLVWGSETDATGFTKEQAEEIVSRYPVNVGKVHVPASAYLGTEIGEGSGVMLVAAE